MSKHLKQIEELFVDGRHPYDRTNFDPARAVSTIIAQKRLEMINERKQKRHYQQSSVAYTGSAYLDKPKEKDIIPDDEEKIDSFQLLERSLLYAEAQLGSMKKELLDSIDVSIKLSSSPILPANSSPKTIGDRIIDIKDRADEVAKVFSETCATLSSLHDQKTKAMDEIQRYQSIKTFISSLDICRKALDKRDFSTIKDFILFCEENLVSFESDLRMKKYLDKYKSLVSDIRYAIIDTVSAFLLDDSSSPESSPMPSSPSSFDAGRSRKEEKHKSIMCIQLCHELTRIHIEKIKSETDVESYHRDSNPTFSIAHPIELHVFHRVCDRVGDQMNGLFSTSISLENMTERYEHAMKVLKCVMENCDALKIDENRWPIALSASVSWVKRICPHLTSSARLMGQQWGSQDDPSGSNKPKRRDKYIKPTFMIAEYLDSAVIPKSFVQEEKERLERVQLELDKKKEEKRAEDGDHNLLAEEDIRSPYLSSSIPDEVVSKENSPTYNTFVSMLGVDTTAYPGFFTSILTPTFTPLLHILVESEKLHTSQVMSPRKLLEVDIKGISTTMKRVNDKIINMIFGSGRLGLPASSISQNMFLTLPSLEHSFLVLNVSRKRIVTITSDFQYINIFTHHTELLLAYSQYILSLALPFSFPKVVSDAFWANPLLSNDALILSDDRNIVKKIFQNIDDLSERIKDVDLQRCFSNEEKAEIERIVLEEMIHVEIPFLAQDASVALIKASDGVKRQSSQMKDPTSSFISLPSNLSIYTLLPFLLVQLSSLSSLSQQLDSYERRFLQTSSIKVREKVCGAVIRGKVIDAYSSMVDRCVSVCIGIIVGVCSQICNVVLSTTNLPALSTMLTSTKAHGGLNAKKYISLFEPFLSSSIMAELVTTITSGVLAFLQKILPIHLYTTLGANIITTLPNALFSLYARHFIPYYSKVSSESHHSCFARSMRTLAGLLPELIEAKSIPASRTVVAQRKCTKAYGFVRMCEEEMQDIHRGQDLLDDEISESDHPVPTPKKKGDHGKKHGRDKPWKRKKKSPSGKILLMMFPSLFEQEDQSQKEVNRELEVFEFALSLCQVSKKDSLDRIREWKSQKDGKEV
ncbi:hypothetical protein ADUPG1_013682 [Aduncisulcus paluster]|uniref:Uncharacterized protein n=1 Tax=Aduncisulcus paluster TaxID=2918883 RepID=A0ABQ5K3R6_9EUKA|nr:hypothetical protein ADUPG1_013682 [Aduncisulcus paluster]